MRKRLKGIQIFLVIAIPLFILAFPGHLRYTGLSQAKFISSDLTVENPDQEEKLPDNEKELKAYRPSILLMIFLLGISLFEQSSYLFPRSLSLLQKTPILRC
jgi:hypothetical protein